MAHRALSVSLLLFASTGCAGAIAEDMAEEVPEPLITESLETMQQPDTRELITEIAAMPEIQEATRTFVARITDGAFAAMDDEARGERITQAVQGFVREVSQTLADQLGAQIAPALSQGVASGLERALVRLTDEESLEDIAELAQTLGRAGARELVYGMHEALQDPEVQRTAGMTARNLGYQVAMGAGEAIEDIEDRQHGSRASGATEAPQASGAAQSSETPWAALAAAALAALLLAVALSSAYRVRRRERALLAVADALKSAEGRSWEADLRRMLSRRFRDDPDAEYLRELLRRHPELRLGGSDEEPPPRHLEPAEAT